MDTITVEMFRGQKRDAVMLNVSPGMTVRQVVETCCRRFEIIEDWNYGFLCERTKKWLIDWSTLDTYTACASNTLVLRVKSPEYHDQEAKSLHNQTLQYTTGRPPIITVHQLPMLNEHNVGSHSGHGFLASISGLFTKNEKRVLESKIRNRRLYLSALLFAGDGRVLLTREGLLPTVCVNSKNDALCRDLEPNSDEFHWLLRDALDWERGVDATKDLELLLNTKAQRGNHRPIRSVRLIGRRRRSQTAMAEFGGGGGGDDSNDNSSRSRSSLADSVASFDVDYTRWHDTERSVHDDFSLAAADLRRLLRLPTLGVLHERPITVNRGEAHMLVMVQHIPTDRLSYVASDLVKSGTLRWRERDQMDKMTYEWQEDLWWRYQCAYNGRLSRLAGGLYLAVFYAENTVRGLNIMVPKRRRSFLPVCKIRDDPTLGKDEHAWLSRLAGELELMPSDDAALPTEIVTTPPGSPVINKARVYGGEHGRTSSDLCEDLHGGDFRTAFARSYHQLQRSARVSWRPCDLYMERCITLDAEGGLRFEDDHSRPAAARILLVVKPMRQAQHRPLSSRDAADFEMFPLTLFEMLHQQTYNADESGRVRRRTQAIIERLGERKSELQQLLDASVSCGSQSEPPSRTSAGDEAKDCGDRIDTPGELTADNPVARTELAIAQLEEELVAVRQQNSAALWTRRIITWDRDRALRRTMLMAAPSAGSMPNLSHPMPSAHAPVSSVSTPSKERDDPSSQLLFPVAPDS
ncbi:hypothetical protein THASP1DRAFT_27608, partial [Thamnocephalis sphaerospora]